jgi:hypothetical protein
VVELPRPGVHLELAALGQVLDAALVCLDGRFGVPGLPGRPRMEALLERMDRARAVFELGFVGLTHRLELEAVDAIQPFDLVE